MPDAMSTLEDMTIEVREKDGSAAYRLLNDSVFNIYNVVAAVSLFRQLGYPREKIQHFFSSMDIVGSRYDARQVGDSVIHLMLAKDENAFAGSRVFEYIAHTQGKKEIIIMNSCQGDAVHWSENICWLYDCDFEFLNSEDIINVVVCEPGSETTGSDCCWQVCRRRRSHIPRRRSTLRRNFFCLKMTTCIFFTALTP